MAFSIVHFSQDFAPGKPQLGGFSRIYNLCRDDNDHVVFTIAETISTIEAFDLGRIHVVVIPVRALPKSRVMQLRTVAPVASQIATYLKSSRRHVDIAFGHSQLFNFFVLDRVCAQIAPRPSLLWEANAVWGVVKDRSLRHSVANRFNLLVQRHVFMRADAVVFQTEAARQLVIQRFGIAGSKCHVVTNAVELGDTDPSFADRRPYRLLCLGLFDEMNGIPFLADAIRREPLTELELTFIGDGKYRAEVEALREQGLCRYLGTLPHAEMQAKYREYDFVLIPRLSRIEADLFIPTKLLEAMHQGLVPICSDVRAMRDIVRDGYNGLLFRAGDTASLRATLRRAARLGDFRRLAERAQRTVREGYDWRVNHDRLAGIYERLSPAR